MRLALSVLVSFLIIRSRLDLGLSRPSHYVPRKICMSKALPRLSMKYTARPSRWERIAMALAFPCFFSRRFLYFIPAGLPRRKSAAASEKAHLRCGLPILRRLLPDVLPADSCLLVTRRA